MVLEGLVRRPGLLSAHAAPDLIHEYANLPGQGLIRLALISAPAILPLTDKGGRTKFLKSRDLEAVPFDVLRLTHEIIDRVSTSLITVECETERLEGFKISSWRWHIPGP